MLVHRRVTPSIKFASTHLYTWVERGTVRVKCLAQEHNTMFPARDRTRSAHSRVERTNHEATAPPRSNEWTSKKQKFTSSCLKGGRGLEVGGYVKRTQHLKRTRPQHFEPYFCHIQNYFYTEGNLKKLVYFNENHNLRDSIRP